MLHFPAVGESVEVGVDRARVHAAAAEADRLAVVRRRAVHKAQLHKALPAACREHAKPRAAFHSVGNAVEIGVCAVGIAEGYAAPSVDDYSGRSILLHRAGVRREELVEPSRRGARVVLVDGVAVLVCVAGVDAGELVCPCERVAIEVMHALLAKTILILICRIGIRVAVHIEFPAIRHAVEVGIGTVRRDGRLVASRLGERLGERGRDAGRCRRVRCRRLVVATFSILFGRGRHDDIRVSRLIPQDSPREDGFRIRDVVAIRLRVVYSIVHAVLHDEILVVRLVRTRIDRTARAAQEFATANVALGIPAVGDISIVVHAPCGTRIEPKGVVYLVVNKDELEIWIHQVTAIERFLKRQNVVDHVKAPDPVLGNLFCWREVALEAVYDIRLARGIELWPKAVTDDLLAYQHPIAAGVFCVVFVYLKVGKYIHPRACEDALFIRWDKALEVAHVCIRRAERHVVPVGVFVTRTIERVEAHHDLPPVAQVVAVGIPMAGVGADYELFEVGESVVVEVERSLLVLDARVEALPDIGRGDFRADEYIARIEALEYVRLRANRLGVGAFHRCPDLRQVPEVILPAIGEAVGVGVFERRIHAGCSVLAARLGTPERQVEAVRTSPIVSSCRLVRLGVCIRLIRAERHDARGYLGLVEAVVEAAQLKLVAERNPYRRIARAATFPDAGEEILVGVAAGDVGEVVLLGVAAGSRDYQRLFAVTPASHGEVVGDSVLVDVAEVVLEHPFLREHRLDVDRYEGLVFSRGGRQLGRDGNRLRQGLLGRDRKRPFRRGAFLLRGRD